MYIHSTYKFIYPNQTAMFYKKLLKEVSPISLRRANKFNVLSVYGALNCVKDFEPNPNLNIYIATQYGVISGIKKVIEALNEEESMVMPFDFLNINGNNAGFNISNALDTHGESMVMTSSHLSFEQTLKYAFTKSKVQSDFEALVGGVDESLEDIEEYDKYIDNQFETSYDGSCWLYCSNNPKNAIAKIEDIKEFANQNELQKYLSANTFKTVDYNYLMTEKKYSTFYGTQSAGEIIDLISENKQNSIYISSDTRKRFTIIKISSFL